MQKIFKELTELKQRFPEQFSMLLYTPSVPAGWYPLMEAVCEEIHKTGEDIKFTQIKEKFGSLRMYTTLYESSGLQSIFEAAEELSSSMCVMCGKDAELVVLNNWMTPLCKEHKKEAGID
jgi:hypothetical protein